MRLALILGIALIALSFGGCGTTRDVHLTGSAGALFTKLTGARGITASEKTTIYGTANPPDAQLVCHEEHHKRQAKVIADAWAIPGVIDDDEISRQMAWVAAYSIEWLLRGYDGNRFELGARSACADVP